MQRYLNGPFFLSVFKVSTRRNAGSKSASVQTCRSLILSASQYPRASTSTFTSTVTVTPTVIVNRRSKLFSSTTSFTPIKVASESADNNNNNPNNKNDNNTNDAFFSDQSFADIGITSPILLQRLAAMGLHKPSTVQEATYQVVAEGTDVIIGAESGSGKTLAYLLPIINHILTTKQGEEGTPNYDFCRAIILVPNRELVQQIISIDRKSVV